MSKLKYTITKFDNELKLLDVVFEDGSWAQIQLATPLPTTAQQLEEIIKKFAAPIEVIEAQQNSIVDLSYIDPLVGQQRECDRFSLVQPNTIEQQQLDPAILAELAAKENEEFKNRLSVALTELGLLA